MALSLIRFCRRHPLKSLSNEYFSLEQSCPIEKIILRQNCNAVSFITNDFANTHVKKTPLRTLHNCHGQKHFTTEHGSVGKIASCPLRSFFPSSLQNDSKLLIKYYSCDQSRLPELSGKDKLKRAVKDYGATVIVFHVSISLVSLGCCYLAVTSGINVGDFIGGSSLDAKGEIATEAGLFVVAYALHKILAPVRIAITLGATPIIVRYLRKINVLKPPKPL